MSYTQLPKNLIDHLFILRTDIKNTITFVSKGLSTMTGYSEEELLGKDPKILGDLSTDRSHISDLWNSLNTVGLWEGIIRNVKKDGTKYYQNTKIYKEFDDLGNHIGYYSINNDVTKEVETSKKLKDLDRAKNTFFANFSHEIRTPLNATIGFVELMKEQVQDHTLNEYLNIILDNSRHLLDMMNDVIDFTSIDNDKIEIVPREFSPKDIQSTIEIFYAKSLEKEIDFTVYLSPQLPERITQDILRIKQVISNLLSNAMKFTDYGGKIVIDVYNDKENLYITVEDNGIGMTKEQQDKIFSPFQQASNDTELRYGGTGLGLAVVKKIVNKMGGDIVVESELERGTKFKISLPMVAYKEKELITKLDIKNIYLYVPSFSEDKRVILRRYVSHFTNSNIIFISKIKENKLSHHDIVIVFKDDISVEDLEYLTHKTKILLLKKFNDILIANNLNELNIQEINLPMLGSKLYDALYSLVHNKILIKSMGSMDIKDNLQLFGRVLLAEDMEANVHLMKNIFDKFEGITYNIVPNGKDAVNEYIQSIRNGKSTYNMIFLDENMPILSGSKAAEKIRKYEELNDIDRIPLIALTANRYGNRDNRLLIDMDEYISKPLDIKELFSILLKYTSNKSMSIDNISKTKSEKILFLKNIRDAFMNKDYQIVKNKISEIMDSFRTSDKEILKILSETNNPTVFNQNYNKILKNIRKENK